MGAAIRSQMISSPSDRRGETHSHQDRKVPWEHSPSMETSAGIRRSQDHHLKIDISPEVRERIMLQSRHSKPSCQKDGSP